MRHSQNILILAHSLHMPNVSKAICVDELVPFSTGKILLPIVCNAYRVHWAGRYAKHSIRK